MQSVNVKDVGYKFGEVKMLSFQKENDRDREIEVFGIVRENYGRANQEYLKHQVKTALEQPTMTKEETLDGLLELLTVGGCGGLNEYYRPFLFNAISHLMR